MDKEILIPLFAVALTVLVAIIVFVSIIFEVW